MHNHLPPPTDPLGKLTPQQQHGIEYLALIGRFEGDPQVTVGIGPHDAAVVRTEVWAAVIAPNGDFWDPTDAGDPPQVTLPYSEYFQHVAAQRQQQAAQSAQDN